MSNLEQPLAEEIKEIVKSINIPNIAVIGRTGVGKSTLINSIFGRDFTITGAGLPKTKNFIRYPVNNSIFFPIVIYDSPGYEAAREMEWVNKVVDFLDEKREKDLKEQIHLVWYVINASSARVDFFERDILNVITQQHIPAIIVLSQCDRAKPQEIKGIEEALNSFQLNKIYSVIKTSATPLEINGKPIHKPFGLTELVDKTIKLLPEIYSEAVTRAQIVDLNSKKKLAWQYIVTAAGACLTAGVLPIPGTTPAAAIASQVTLSIKIASIYGYADFAYFLSTVGVLSISSISNIFLTATLDLLSTVFPPTRALSGGLAATFITVIGLTYASVFEKLSKSHVYMKGKEATEEFLKTAFRQEIKNYLNIRIISNKNLEEVGHSFLYSADSFELQEFHSHSSNIDTTQEFEDDKIIEQRGSIGGRKQGTKEEEIASVLQKDSNSSFPNSSNISKTSPSNNTFNQKNNSSRLRLLMLTGMMLTIILNTLILIFKKDINLFNYRKSDHNAHESNRNLTKTQELEKLLEAGKSLIYYNLSNADLRNANFQNADLRNVNFKSANLSNANLKNANLSNADLSNALLIDTNLQSANLSNANLKNADLSNADLSSIQNLTPKEVKFAQNWEKAKYSKDFRTKLGCHQNLSKKVDLTKCRI